MLNPHRDNIALEARSCAPHEFVDAPLAQRFGAVLREEQTRFNPASPFFFQVLGTWLAASHWVRGWRLLLRVRGWRLLIGYAVGGFSYGCVDGGFSLGAPLAVSLCTWRACRPRRRSATPIGRRGGRRTRASGRHHQTTRPTHRHERATTERTTPTRAKVALAVLMLAKLRSHVLSW